MSKTRWRIHGTFSTVSPLHIGSGAISTHPRLNVSGDDQKKTPCEIQAVVKSHSGKPCMPGTAIKGVLRAWAERFLLPQEEAGITRIFGKRDAGAKDAESGWAEFGTAICCSSAPVGYLNTVPYWKAEQLVGITSHVSIDRRTGAAEANKLFFEEFVPEGIRFEVDIEANRLDQAEIELLLAILENGACDKHGICPNHPYQFGANGADGWGRVSWQGSVEKCDKPGGTFVSVAVGSKQVTPVKLNEAVFDLTLMFAGPFLVNDASKGKPPNFVDLSEEEKRKFTDFNPLLKADGSVWLPASSFRGALRSRAEFLAKSRGTTDSIAKLFGDTGHAARLTIEEFTEIGACPKRKQDFVAIDRFTGGAADGAKFDAWYADRPGFHTWLTLDLEGLNEEDLTLFAMVLRDVCKGRVTFGFGAAKGYGEATGELNEAAHDWVMEFLKVTNPQKSASPTPPEEGLVPGELTVTAGKPGFFLHKIAGKRVPRERFSLDLHEKIGVHSVQFVMRENQPDRVRLAGGIFQPPPSAQGATAAPQPTHSRVPNGQFANPYYFLPLKDRSDRSAFAGELKDGPPIDHEKFHENRFSGSIKVRLTAKTPLLICDDGDRNEEHATYGIRLQDGKPLLASSSVRGMLRAAYEAITNSRFGVFPAKPEESDVDKQANARRFGFRMEAGEGLSLVPVRIEGGKAHLMLGTNPGLPFFDRHLNRWIVPDGLLHAAWVEQYDPKVATKAASYVPGPASWAIKIKGNVPEHGSQGFCWLELIQHSSPNFKFWKVREAAATEAELSATAPEKIRPTGKYSPTEEPPRKRGGYFFASNQNIKNKHDERFFFVTDETDVPPIEIPDTVKTKYIALVKDYQTIHTDEIEDRKKSERKPERKSPDAFLGGEPGKTAFSRHVYEARAAEFSDGTLCYAKVDKHGSQYKITALYPVTISRKLYDQSPLDLLPQTLQPAKSEAEFSPADRVFGWVGAKKDGDDSSVLAYRSHLRVGPVTCISTDAVEPLGKTLAILGQPKPAQGRFYVGNNHGLAQANGGTKEDRGYKKDNRLRGPKVYPHHGAGVVEDYAYVLGPDRQNKQNRTITDCVREGAEFEFTLHVTNLSKFELAALIWLLQLKPGHYLRLGLGKPLGFGSVRAEIVPDGTLIAAGQAWIAALGTESGLPPAGPLPDAVKDFERVMDAANPNLLKSFRKAAAGFDRVHYPGVPGKIYEWFVANEKPRAAKVSLPDLFADPTLPDQP